MSLHISAVSPEPTMLAYIKYGCRGSSEEILGL